MGPRLQHPAVLTLLERFGSPARIRKAGRRRLVTLLRPKAPRMAERLVEDIFPALDEETVIVSGTEAAALIVPSLAGSRRRVTRIPSGRPDTSCSAVVSAGASSVGSARQLRCVTTYFSTASHRFFHKWKRSATWIASGRAVRTASA